MPVPRNHLTYALAASGIMALAITFAVGRSSPSPPMLATDGDTPTAMTTTTDFDETWRSSSGSLALQTAATEAKLVPMIKIVPDPPPPPPSKVMPPLVPSTEIAAAAAEVTAKPRVRNLCERHGMHKVMTGRYAWRCRK